MIYRIDFISGKENGESRSELVNITLLAESDLEESIFNDDEKRKDKQAIEKHYYAAIERELTTHKLVSIVENYGYSKSAVARVTTKL